MAEGERNPNWLADEEWKRVQGTMPIACVDVLPVKLSSNGAIVEQVGFIRRDTPHQGKRWCLVGGRMWRNESFVEAATRQLRETLGPHIRFRIEPEAHPHHVVQYFTHPREIGLFDPRQHAVAIVFVVAIEGTIIAGGEADAFRWFNPGSWLDACSGSESGGCFEAGALPPSEHFGFGQDQVARACLRGFRGADKRDASDLTT